MRGEIKLNMDNAVICSGLDSSPSLIEVILLIYIPACEKPVGDNEKRPIHVV